MFSITSDLSAGLMRVTVTGALLDEFERFSDEMRAHAQRIKAGKPYYDMLVDVRDMTITPQADADQQSDEMVWHVKNGLRKSANLVSSKLLELQFRRLAPHPAYKFFETEEEALAWLAVKGATIRLVVSRYPLGNPRYSSTFVPLPLLAAHRCRPKSVPPEASRQAPVVI